MTLKFSREWAMPSTETFSIFPIRALLKRHIDPWMVVIDPFARNSKVGTITNDLNPETTAEHHLEACEFLDLLIDRGVWADVCLLDPPYSNHQVIANYQGIGREFTADDDVNRYAKYRRRFDTLLKPFGVVISFGWHTNGWGNYRLEEVLMVPHGRVHHDTLVTVERKLQAELNFRAQAHDNG